MKIKNRKLKATSGTIAALYTLFLMIIFFFTSFYMRTVTTLSSNIRTDIDDATLAAATIDLSRYAINSDDFYCIGSITPNISISTQEQIDVKKHARTFLSSFTNSAGMEVNHFVGGDLSGAVNMLGLNNMVIDDFIIYDAFKDASGNYKIVEYKISNITKTQIKNIVDNNNFQGLVISKSFTTTPKTSATIVDTSGVNTKVNPTIYAKISFNIKLPNIYEAFGKEKGETRVSVASVSQIKKNSD